MGVEKIKKIFLALEANKKLSSQWQFPHFIDELKRHGISFEIFNSKDYPDGNIEEHLLNKIKTCRKELDLFMTGYTDKILSVPALCEIKKMGIPTLLICYDNLSVPYYHKKIAKYFDLVWLTSYETEYIFKKWGANTIFLPYAANPYKFFPSYNDELLCVGFIGALYGARKYKVKTLDNYHIPARVYTNLTIPEESQTSNLLSKIKIDLFQIFNLSMFSEGRKLIKGDFMKILKKRFESSFTFHNSIQLFKGVSFEEMNQLYSNFALSFGITEVWNTYLLKNPLFKLHLRTFEIPMCGGLQITHQTPEIKQYFEDGKEIILYDSEEEMISKIKFYLDEKNSGLRKSMKLAARKRAENEHTWYIRFCKVNQLLGS